MVKNLLELLLIKSDKDIKDFLRGIENYVDNYWALAQPYLVVDLEYLTRGILCRIGLMFLDRVSAKK